MAFVTMPTIVLGHWTHVAFAMAPVKFTPADVLTFPQAIVIATATCNWTLGRLRRLTQRMWMQMAFVTTRMIALVNSTSVVFATVTAALVQIHVRLPIKHLPTH